MCKRINARNFCQYLALTNMISFNYGFHVHEKAIMLVTIPLGLTLFMNQHSKDESVLKELRVDLARFKLLKLLMIWSYLGLFYTMRDLTTRTVYVILDWIVFKFLVDYQLRAIAGKGMQSSLRVSIYNKLLIVLALCFISQNWDLRMSLINFIKTQVSKARDSNDIVESISVLDVESDAVKVKESINYCNVIIPTIGACIT